MTQLTNVTKENRVNITGTITAMDIADTFNDNNTPIKRGTVTVKVGESEIVLNIYMSEVYRSGKENKSYTLLNELGVGSFANFSCQLDENKFVPDGSTDISRSYRIRASFINKPRAGDVEEATFQYGGVVLSPLKEVTNKEGEVYRYDIMIGQPEYRKDDEVHLTGFNTVRFNVDPRNNNMIEAVRSTLSPLDTVKINGNIVSEITTTQVVEEALIGEGRTITYQNNFTSFNITGAVVVPENQVYSEEQINFLIANTKTADSALKTQPKAAKTAKKTASVKKDPLGDLFG